MALAVAVLGVLAAAPGALAQTAEVDPAEPPRVDAGTGFTSAEDRGDVFGESANPFDLIHRAVLMNETSLNDFSRQHRGRMSNEASNFRTLQQEALRRQAETEAGDPAPEAAPID
ncbi:MAG TPA: hypothetical protein VLS96_09740 [Nodosilinea sp.]|nr:hypothetical protein [Nodosilinea sp.]